MKRASSGCKKGSERLVVFAGRHREWIRNMTM